MTKRKKVKDEEGYLGKPQHDFPHTVADLPSDQRRASLGVFLRRRAATQEAETSGEACEHSKRQAEGQTGAKYRKLFQEGVRMFASIRETAF